MKIPSLFKTNKESTIQEPQQQWIKKNKWASCKYPKTESFRANVERHDEMIIKTVNSVFLATQVVETEEMSCFREPESCTASISSATDYFKDHDFANCSEEDIDGNEAMEMVVRGVVTVRSSSNSRLLFESNNTNSILEEAKPGGFLFKESVVMEMESKNPYFDFRRSMEEMVESHGVKDWKGLEELLSWYLKVNRKKNHGLIVNAFVDLILHINSNSDFASYDEEKSSAAFSSF